MSTYGITFYGAGSLYGEQVSLLYATSFFQATPATPARAGAYERLLVEWAHPAGDWDSLRLVRHFSGFPVNEGDGDVLLDVDAGSAPTDYDDQNLVGGKVVYYTLFVDDAGVWYRAGNAWAVVVEDHGFEDLLFDLLPDSVRLSDYDSSRSLPEAKQDPLYRFLQVFGFEMNHIRTELDVISRPYDVDHTPGVALFALGESFGVPSEPTLGLRRYRALARDAAYLARVKGTALGVEGAVSALTGFAANASTGLNLLLARDHTHFVMMTGTGVGGTVLEEGSGGPDTSSEFGIAPDTAGTAYISMTQERSGDVRKWAIPVEESTTYTYSVESEVDAAHDHTVTLTARFYDVDGTFLSDSSSAALDPDTNGTGTWDRIEYSFATPASTAFVGIDIVLASPTSTDDHYFRYAQLEEDSTFSAYEPPREAQVTLVATRVNEFPTPSFEDFDALSSKTNTTATVFDATDVKYGAKSLLVTSDGTANSVLRGLASKAPSDPSQSWAARVSVRLPTGGTDIEARVSLQFLDVGESVTGETHSDYEAVTDSDWLDLSVLGAAPAGTTDVCLRIETQRSAGSGAYDFALDGALLEQATAVGVYFDGDNTPPADDYLWEGTAQNSRSHYYPNRGNATARLNLRMVDFLPLGRQFSLLVAQA